MKGSFVFTKDKLYDREGDTSSGLDIKWTTSRYHSVVSKSYQKAKYLFKLWPLLPANTKSASFVINRSPSVRNVKISQIVKVITEGKEDLKRTFVEFWGTLNFVED